MFSFSSKTILLLNPRLREGGKKEIPSSASCDAVIKSVSVHTLLAS